MIREVKLTKKEIKALIEMLKKECESKVLAEVLYKLESALLKKVVK